METGTVSVIVVTHNSGALLHQCLESLFRSEYPLRELIIVDNASSDGSIEEIQRRFPNLGVILNQKNLGYARAANMGIIASSGNIVALINP